MDLFNSANLENLRIDINKALAPVAEKHGIVIEARNVSYKPTDAKFKVHAEIGEPGERRKQEFLNIIHFAAQIPGCEKLTADHYGTEFKSNTGTFIFDELAINRSAFPIGATKKGTDRHYKFRAAAANLIIENANAGT